MLLLFALFTPFHFSLSFFLPQSPSLLFSPSDFSFEYLEASLFLIRSICKREGATRDSTSALISLKLPLLLGFWYTSIALKRICFQKHDSVDETDHQSINFLEWYQNHFLLWRLREKRYFGHKKVCTLTLKRLINCYWMKY